MEHRRPAPPHSRERRTGPLPRRVQTGFAFLQNSQLCVNRGDAEGRRDETLVLSPSEKSVDRLRNTGRTGEAAGLVRARHAACQIAQSGIFHVIGKVTRAAPPKSKVDRPMAPLGSPTCSILERFPGFAAVFVISCRSPPRPVASSPMP